MAEEYVLGSKVLHRFLGNERFPIEWENDDEKKVLWWYDDLHVARPVSPMYADFCAWWDAKPPMARCCEYMYRRFWAPFGKEWPGKVVNGYVYTGVLPRDSEEAKRAGPYYGLVMPIYADKFLGWWTTRYLPEVQRNLRYLDRYPYAKASLGELLILLEEAYDIFERHWKLHWILNLAQFQSFLQFRAAYQEVFGKVDEEEVGKLLVSVAGKNWESIKGMWQLKEKIGRSLKLRKAFESPQDKAPEQILADLDRSDEGKAFRKELSKYLQAYGNKGVFPHELCYPTWRENPASAIELIRTYLAMNYSYPDDIKRCREERNKAVKAMLARVKDKEKLRKLQGALNLAVKMAPLTPDHHFYFDQGTHARLRYVFLEIGRRLTDQGLLNGPEDVFFLKYNEVRELAANSKAFDAKSRATERRHKWVEAIKIRPVDWIGTATQWSLYEEPYKTLWGYPAKLERALAPPTKQIQGFGGSPGTVEGVAKVVMSPAEFDQVREGDIMVCKMTNPAWINVFPKLKGLVTDAGGLLAHPAIISREFGLPCVVGTSVATASIKSGQRIRVDGSRGVVEVLSA